MKKLITFFVINTIMTKTVEENRKVNGLNICNIKILFIASMAP